VTYSKIINQFAGLFANKADPKRFPLSVQFTEVTERTNTTTSGVQSNSGKWVYIFPIWVKPTLNIENIISASIFRK